MIENSKLSTIDTPQRYGGLLICGLNYGLPKGGTPQPEGDFSPWAPYFTHESNRKGDRFVNRLVLWFTLWNLPLEAPDRTPTDLNLAISQTNLFYDSSKSFAQRTPEEIERAFGRLKNIINHYHIAGVLLTAKSMADAAQAKLELGEWETSQSGRFSLWLASRGDAFRVAVCPHPSRPQSDEDVKGVGKKMREWIAWVMQQHQKRQNERE